MTVHPNFASFNVQIGDIVHCFKKPKPNEPGYDWWTSDEGMDSLVGQSGIVIGVESYNGYGPLVKFEVLPNDWQDGGWYIPYTCLKIVR